MCVWVFDLGVYLASVILLFLVWFGDGLVILKPQPNFISICYLVSYHL